MSTLLNVQGDQVEEMLMSKGGHNPWPWRAYVNNISSRKKYDSQPTLKTRKLIKMNFDDQSKILPHDHIIIIDRKGMLHFLPSNLKSETNKWNKDEHRTDLLGNFRVLLEVYILPSNNAKISLRCRLEDPAYQHLVEAANRLGCPTKNRNSDNTTKSIWIHQMGPANGRSPEDLARDFLNNMPEWYKPYMKIVIDMLKS